MEKAGDGAGVQMSWGLAPEGTTTIDDLGSWAWVPVDSVSVVDQAPERADDLKDPRRSFWATSNWQGVSMVGVHRTNHNAVIEQFVLDCFGPPSNQPPSNRFCAIRRVVVGVDVAPHQLFLDHVVIVRVRRSASDRLYSILDLVGHIPSESSVL